MSKKYTIITYGCQMNEHDSEQISYILENLGYTYTNNKKESDFIIYNTCLIRENAELKVYGQLGSLKNLKKEKKDLIIAVCGCMMQTGNAKNVIAEKYKHVDIIFGTKNISELPELIEKYLNNNKMIISIKDKDEIDTGTKYKRNNIFMGYVNIMTGCNNFCSFCIVPYTRGRELSRKPQDIINEVKEMVENGYKEIMLLGQNVNSYGKNLETKCSFSELLEKINEIKGLKRIRFMTSHPKDLSDDLIDAMARLDKVCESIHLPFQSGSNKVLKEMNRRYTKEHYLELTDKLKKKIPNIVLSTDIIVGFPNETDSDFEETLDVVKKAEFEQGFTFIYSKRPGTKAAKIIDNISDEEKNIRFQKLIDVMYDIFYKKNERYIGKIEEVLVEGLSKNNSNVLVGRTRGYKIVHFKGNKNLIGNLVKVKIINHNSFTLEGILEDR